MSAEVNLKYNPYTKKTELKIEGEEIKKGDGVLYENTNRESKLRLQDWVEKLIPSLYDKINNPFNLIFHGREIDFSDIRQELENLKLKPEYKNVDINLTHSKGRILENNIKLELKKIFDELLRSPFEQIKRREVKDAFNKALNSEVEVGVIATMKAGKSTLINSLLHKDLLPSKTEACTATILKIKDNDSFGNNFKTKYKKFDENKYSEYIENTDVEKLHKINNDGDNVEIIEIEGDIPFCKSDVVNLVLVDTPGPNNARNEKHKEQTYRFLKDCDGVAPLIIYMINARNQLTTDEAELLEDISQIMNKSGLLNRDRFLFIINQIDELTSSENAGNFVNSAIEKLKEKGIEKPKIIPVSGVTANLIRRSKLTELDDDDNDKLDFYKKRFTPKDGDFKNHSRNAIKYSLIPNQKKEKYHKIVEKLFKDGKDDEAVVYLSGVPVLEDEIREYVEKYAEADKICQAVNSFKYILEEQVLKGDLANKISKNKEDGKKLSEKISKIKDEINSGNKGKELRKKIDNFKFDTDKYLSYQKEIMSYLMGFGSRFGENMSPDSFKQEKNEFDKLLADTEIKIKTDLELYFREDVIYYINETINSYRGYIESLVGGTDGIGMSESFNLDEIMKLETTETNQVMEKTSFDKTFWKEKSGFGAKVGRFFDRSNEWGWGRYTESKTFVNGRDAFSCILQPLNEQFDKNFQYLIGDINERILDVKNGVNKLLNELDKKISDKINEIDEMTSNEEKLKNDLKKLNDYKNMAENYLARLDKLLQI